MLRFVFATTFVLIVGCTPSRTDMITPIATRSGLEVVWRGETKSDADVDAAVAALCARELTSDGAVKVALLRNRDLEASYESLGMSEAALVQAGLLENPIFEGTIHVAGNSTSPDFSIGVEENFLSLIFAPARAAAASADVEAARACVTMNVVDTAGAVRAAYVD